MDADPKLLQELRNLRYLLAMAILWAAMSICLGIFGCVFAGLGFLLVAASYYAGPSRR